MDIQTGRARTDGLVQSLKQSGVCVGDDGEGIVLLAFFEWVDVVA